METRIGGSRLNFFQLVVGHTQQPAFAIVPVRGLYIATVQYSSLCVSAVVLTLGGDDIVEDGVPGREQVDSEREKAEVRDQEKRDKTRTKRMTSWMACGWKECAPKTP